MKTQHPEGDNVDKVDPKGVGRGGSMASSEEKPKLTNAELSIEHIKRYFKALPFDRLPSDAKTGDLEKKKEFAEAGLDYLTYLFNSKVGAVMTDNECGPRPHIPELP